MEEDNLIEKLFTVRICHLKKNCRNNSRNNEFGFNLKSKTNGQCCYIGKVDPETPASLAGLRSGDKIIEINNMNVHNLNYDAIMQKIKVGLNRNGKYFTDELLLMVIDNDIDDQYEKINASSEGYNQNFSIICKCSDFISNDAKENTHNSNQIG